MREHLAPLLYPETLRFLLAVTAVLIALSILVRVRWTLPMDQTVTIHLQRLNLPSLTIAASRFTFMGNASTLIVLALVGLGLGFGFRETRAAWFLAGTLIALPLNAILKKIISRERPGATEARVVPGPRWGFSYPSGHSMGSAAFYSFLAVQLYLHTGGRGGWLAGILAAALLPIGIGLSRIYLGAHWMSDVVGGWAAGLMISAMALALYVP